MSREICLTLRSYTETFSDCAAERPALQQTSPQNFIALRAELLHACFQIYFHGTKLSNPIKNTQIFFKAFFWNNSTGLASLTCWRWIYVCALNSPSIFFFPQNSDLGWQKSNHLWFQLDTDVGNRTCPLKFTYGHTKAEKTQKGLLTIISLEHTHKKMYSMQHVI